MPTPDFSFYSGTPFTPNNQVDLLDTFVTTATATYGLTNLTTSNLGATIQAGGTQYWQYNGGFTTTPPNLFTLASIPPVGTQMVAPGVNQVVIAAFDQDTVLGVSNPREQSVPVWLIDHTTINNFKYDVLPTYPGLQISVVQLISGSTAQPSWFQMASADASGNAMTYGASGAPLYLPAVKNIGSLSNSCLAGATSVTVAASAGWMAGMYITLSLGASNSEDVHVIATSGNTLILDPTGTTYSHSASDLVYHIGWKFWLKITVPLNANNNQPVNMYNLGLQRLGAIASRP